MRAIRFHEFGEPDVLVVEEVAEPTPTAHDVLIDVEVAGLNFADVYRLRGDYHLDGELPYINGYEGAGIVRRVGAEVRHLAVGDRVAFMDVPHAHASVVCTHRDNVVTIPDGLSTADAAAILLQGVTAQYLTDDSYAVDEHDRVVVLSAGGGVGRLITQFAANRGSEVIALASTDTKRRIALDAGAAHALASDGEFSREVRGVWSAGATVVYDAVGTTIAESLRAVGDRGIVVTYGMSGGKPAAVDPRMLMERSLTLVGGDLWSYLTSRDERQRRSSELFRALARGDVTLPAIADYGFDDAAEAYRRLQDRSFSGKVLLHPGRS